MGMTLQDVNGWEFSVVYSRRVYLSSGALLCDWSKLHD